MCGYLHFHGNGEREQGAQTEGDLGPMFDEAHWEPSSKNSAGIVFPREMNLMRQSEFTRLHCFLSRAAEQLSIVRLIG